MLLRGLVVESIDRATAPAVIHWSHRVICRTATSVAVRACATAQRLLFVDCDGF
jgi:hypothetical protein